MFDSISRGEREVEAPARLKINWQRISEETGVPEYLAKDIVDEYFRLVRKYLNSGDYYNVAVRGFGIFSVSDYKLTSAAATYAKRKEGRGIGAGESLKNVKLYGPKVHEFMLSYYRHHKPRRFSIGVWRNMKKMNDLGYFDLEMVYPNYHEVAGKATKRKIAEGK